MAYIRKLKRTPTSNVEYLKDSSNDVYATGAGDVSGRFTVSIPGVDTLYDGLTIRIKFSKLYNGTFNTIKVNDTGEKLIWYRSNARMTSHFTTNSIVTFTYYSGNQMASAYSMTNAYSTDYVDKGNWASSTYYAIGDRVSVNSTYYICKKAHTSGSSWSTTNWNAWSSVSTSLSIAKTASYSITDGWFAQFTYADGNDPNYRNRQYYNAVDSIANIGRYQIILENREKKIFSINGTNNSTSTSKTTFTTNEFDPFGRICYYNGTTDYSSATYFSSGGGFYEQYETVDSRYSFNISSSVNYFTARKPVYLVAIPQSNGLAKLYYGDSGADYKKCLTHTLPTTEDGLIYIYLGQARDTYQMTLALKKPIYYYKNGRVRLYYDIPEYDGSVTYG